MKTTSTVAVALAALMVLLFALSGCAEKEREVLRICNWADYFDITIINDFEADYERQTGKKIKVVHHVYETYYKINNELRNQEAQYDLVMLTSHEASVLAHEGLLRPLDRDQLPPFDIYFRWTLDMPSDPENKYTVPYSYGAAGILYNPKHPGVNSEEMNSWAALWDEKFKNRMQIYGLDNIGLFMIGAIYTSLVDLQEASMQYTYPPKYKVALLSILQNASPKALKEVSEALEQQRKLIKKYGGNEAKYDMINDENYDVGLFLSSDAVFAMQQNRNLRFSIPREGTYHYLNCWCIPKSAQNAAAAHAFLKFITQPDIALRNMQVVGIPSAVASVTQDYLLQMETTDERFFAGATPEWKEQYLDAFFVLKSRRRSVLRSLLLYRQYDVIDKVIQAMKDDKAEDAMDLLHFGRGDSDDEKEYDD